MALFTMPSVHGALHLIADSQAFNFPTPAERLIWKLSCYISVAPGAMTVPHLLSFVVSYWLIEKPSKGLLRFLIRHLFPGYANKRRWPFSESEEETDEEAG